MALENAQNAVDKLEGQTQDAKNSIANVIKELQGLKVSLVDGATADTNIAVSGITTEDTLVSVIGFDPDNATAADQVKDFTGNTSITSNGNIQTSVDTSGYDLLVIWFDKS